jgi:hypothetical protein
LLKGCFVILSLLIETAHQENSFSFEIQSVLCDSLIARSVQILSLLDYKDAQSSQLILEIARFQIALLRVFQDTGLLRHLHAVCSPEAAQQYISGLGTGKQEEVRRVARSIWAPK